MKSSVLCPLLVASYISGSVICEARVGETLEQCAQRYGAMLRVESAFMPNYPQYIFRKGEVEIRVRLYKGVSAQEVFSSIDGAKLTDAQIGEIRAANGCGERAVRCETEYRMGIVAINEAEFDAVFRKERGATTGF